MEKIPLLWRGARRAGWLPNSDAPGNSVAKLGKTWFQPNRTETDIAEAFVEMGVPKEDIVLGLHPPYKHPYTGYGMPQLEPIFEA